MELELPGEMADPYLGQEMDKMSWNILSCRRQRALKDDRDCVRKKQEAA